MPRQQQDSASWGLPSQAWARTLLWLSLLVVNGGGPGGGLGFANIAPLPEETTRSQRMLPSSCPAELGEADLVGGPKTRTTIVIWKSKSKLGFYVENELAQVGEGHDACFDAVLGISPALWKAEQRDLGTLEGWYWVIRKLPHERKGFHKAVHLNYPNESDAALALAEGRIDEAEYVRISGAAALGLLAPDVTLGPPIAIHGLGSVSRDWTLGFLGLVDADMDWLYEAVECGETAVHIRP